MWWEPSVGGCGWSHLGVDVVGVIWGGCGGSKLRSTTIV